MEQLTLPLPVQVDVFDLVPGGSLEGFEEDISPFLVNEGSPWFMRVRLTEESLNRVLKFAPEVYRDNLWQGNLWFSLDQVSY